MNGKAPAILDHLASLADTTRSRILLLLDRHELTVSELCGIVQLPQSTVSRHLKALADSGWVASRAEGTSNLYTMTRDELDASARRLWALVREQVGRPGRGAGSTAAAGRDRRAADEITEFFSVRGAVGRVRRPLGDRAISWPWRPSLRPTDCRRPRLRHRQVSTAPAPFVERGRRRRGGGCAAAKKRTRFRECRSPARGEPRGAAGRRCADAATLMLVLHHVPNRSARWPKSPGSSRHGQAVIVDMLPHDRESYRQQMGHVWLGSATTTSVACFGKPDSNRDQTRSTSRTRAKGPGLFVAKQAGENKGNRDREDATAMKPPRRG
jgi:ArsR family transcriptional regulator